MKIEKPKGAFDLGLSTDLATAMPPVETTGAGRSQIGGF